MNTAEDITLAIECMKIATNLVSPSVNNREEEVARVAKIMYANVKSMVGETPSTGNTADKPKSETLRMPRK